MVNINPKLKFEGKVSRFLEWSIEGTKIILG
jgi:hypothetical protein